jgi:hypothetical protein
MKQAFVTLLLTRAHFFFWRNQKMTGGSFTGFNPRHMSSSILKVTTEKRFV